MALTVIYVGETLDRLTQVNGSDTEYLLGDALGSVRQLTNAKGMVTLAKSYDPYGNVSANDGTDSTAYGHTGEEQDSYIKLIDLRSRMYSRDWTVPDTRFWAR